MSSQSEKFTSAPQVLISEVGLRDGLQSVARTMPTADKLRWIDALVAAGLRELEVCSFVPAKLLPQMADAAEVVRHALTHPGITVMALVPNVRGAEAAYDVGVRTFDASLGGLGGCPYAPGASGNVVTEDLVFMFEASGISTGVDITRLIAARTPLQAGLPGEPLYGMTPEAGLPLGFSTAAA